MVTIIALYLFVTFCTGMTVSNTNVIHTSLIGQVTNTSVYNPIMAVENATENDVVVITVDSPGGYVNAGMQLIRAMRESHAHKLIVNIEQEANSMAALIAAEADVIQIDDNEYLMFHMIGEQKTDEDGRTYFVKYTAQDPESVHRESYAWFTRLLPSLRHPVLTADEFTRVKAGEDVYITGAEYHKRYGGV